MSKTKKFCLISNIFCIVISLIYAIIMANGVMFADLLVTISEILKDCINSNVLLSLLSDIIKAVAILSGLAIAFILIANIGSNITLCVTGFKCKTSKGYLINGIFKLVYCVISLIIIFNVWSFYNGITESIIKWIFLIICISTHLLLFIFSLLQCINNKK